MGRKPDGKIGPVHPGPRNLCTQDYGPAQARRPDIRLRGLPPAEARPHPTDEAKSRRSSLAHASTHLPPERGGTIALALRPTRSSRRSAQSRRAVDLLDDRKPVAVARQGRAKRVGSADKPLTGHSHRQRGLTKRATAQSAGARNDVVCRSSPSSVRASTKGLTRLAPYKGRGAPPTVKMIYLLSPHGKTPSRASACSTTTPSGAFRPGRPQSTCSGSC
jgi:hypothetical protein